MLWIIFVVCLVVFGGVVAVAVAYRRAALLATQQAERSMMQVSQYMMACGEALGAKSALEAVLWDCVGTSVNGDKEGFSRNQKRAWMLLHQLQGVRTPPFPVAVPRV